MHVPTTQTARAVRNVRRRPVGPAQPAARTTAAASLQSPGPERALSAASLNYSPCAAAAACPRHQALLRQRCSDGSARLSPRVGHLHSKQLCVSTTAEALAPPRAVSDRGAPTGDDAAVRLLPWRSSVSTRALRALSALERQQAASFCPARALAAPGVPEKSMHNLNAAAFARRLKKRRPGFAIRAALKPLWNLGSDLG